VFAPLVAVATSAVLVVVAIVTPIRRNGGAGGGDGGTPAGTVAVLPTDDGSGPRQAPTAPSEARSTLPQYTPGPERTRPSEEARAAS